MPVNTRHPQYEATVNQWQRCRDAADGSDAVKARGTEYLPRLSDQSDQEYEAYKMRAMWYGATARTIQGLMGAVFRKAPQVTVPSGIEPHLKDVTLTGVPFEAFAKTTVAEILKTGRYGVLVDMGTDDAVDKRPYWVAYTAGQIINWRTIQRDGDTVLTQVVLEESAPVPGDDAFEHKTVPQYRVLKLVEGKYLVELWRQKDGKPDEWEVQQTLTPQFRGQPLDYIPFCFIGPTHLTTDVDKPPLLDLVDVNLSHYRSSADLEHGRHFCGLPTPWVAGFPENTKLKIGSSVAWVSNDVQAKAGMLEFTGQGLGALVTACEHKERIMAVLGARMLEEQKKAIEAADTHRLRGAGEQSVLQSIAGTVEAALKKVLEWHVTWAGQSADGVELELNKDFAETRMQPTELAELVKTWQGGAISHETLYWNLQRGDLTRPDVTFEDEKKLIDEEAPARLPLQDSEPTEPFS